ncbi:MAG: aspartyl protease family protein [Polaromonas sp.]
MIVAVAGAGLMPSGLQARTPSVVSTVPFELYKGHIFVSAYINGAGPYRFGFDTGASGDGRADALLTAELSLPKAGQSETSDGIRTATVDLVAVKSLRLGPVEKHNLELVSRDYNSGRKDEHSIMGIIGRDFVADWLVTIDDPKRTINFRRGHLRAGHRGAIHYGPSFSVPVCFATGCFSAKIDTGSSRSIVIPKDLAAKLSGGVPVHLGQVKRTNSSAALYEITVKEPVRVGGVKVRAQKVLYTDPSDTVINVGSDFLKDYVLTIDQANQLLRISKP